MMSDDTASPKPGLDRLQEQVTAEQIQAWIVNYLAKSLDTQPEQIDVSTPFTSLAMDSITPIEMTGALEDWLNCRIDPSVVEDHPTIEKMAAYLANNR